MGSKPQPQSQGVPTTYAPPAPPTAANAAAVQAAADARQKSLQKKGINSTLLNQDNNATADKTGGNMFAPATPTQKNTLLGGG